MLRMVLNQALIHLGEVIDDGRQGWKPRHDGELLPGMRSSLKEEKRLKEEILMSTYAVVSHLQCSLSAGVRCQLTSSNGEATMPHAFEISADERTGTVASVIGKACMLAILN